jgi:hypothetical protein
MRNADSTHSHVLNRNQMAMKKPALVTQRGRNDDLSWKLNFGSKLCNQLRQSSTIEDVGGTPVARFKPSTCCNNERQSVASAYLQLQLWLLLRYHVRLRWANRVSRQLERAPAQLLNTEYQF